jgi:hypothetical protein
MNIMQILHTNYLFLKVFITRFNRVQQTTSSIFKAFLSKIPQKAIMVSNDVILFSVVFKSIAMIIGVLGNITVIIYTLFLSKEKTATTFLVGNLALADLLVCLTFYPIWIIELIQTILNIDSDQDLFCKLSRSTLWSLLFASVATLLAITVDRYLYIVKPLKYPLIVTRRRVTLAISGIWSTSCCLCIILLVHYEKFGSGLRSICYAGEDDIIFLLMSIFVGYFPLTLILILNFQILNVARKQRKRILAESTVTVNTSGEQSSKRLVGVVRFLVCLKAAKTFAIVVAVLTFCVLTPTMVGLVIERSCESCYQMWYIVFQFEFYGVNSIVNAFIYGMRHIKYIKAYGNILLKILRCNKLTNLPFSSSLSEMCARFLRYFSALAIWLFEDAH